MENHITYHRYGGHMEYVYYRNAFRSYPVHTHAAHAITGYVTEGVVRIMTGDRECFYEPGDSFHIMPDIPHKLEPAGSGVYSMLCICMSVGMATDKPEGACGTEAKKLKRIISDAPENPLSVRDMARFTGVSPYYLIRCFKAACGLTPHQFQIQCRVRMAQRLLEAGESVTEAAYDAGFCDQSHFDRCFRKIVGLTPSAYKRSVKLLP